MSSRPFLVIKAHIDSSILSEFERWYREVHLENMLKIPGVVGAYRLSGPRSDRDYWFTVLKFKDETALQEALNSTEASKARQAWQRWMPYISEMSVEVYASLSSLITYHHRN
jgi:hypothetical protein